MEGPAGPIPCSATPLSARKLTLGLIYVGIRQQTRRDWLSAPKKGPSGGGFPLIVPPIVPSSAPPLSARKLALGLIYVGIRQQTRRNSLSAPKKAPPRAGLTERRPRRLPRRSPAGHAGPAPPRPAPKGPSRLLSGHMATRDPLAEQAVVLVSTLDGGGEALDAAVQKLAEASDRPALELAQRDLVGRIPAAFRRLPGDGCPQPGQPGPGRGGLDQPL